MQLLFCWRTDKGRNLTENCNMETNELVKLESTFELAAPPTEDANGDVTFWAIGLDKSKTPNRRGLVFDWKSPADIDITAFLKNPVMPYAHDSGSVPIGRWEKVQVTKSQVKLFGRIPGGDDYPDLAPIRARVRDGYLKAVSIGFYIREAEEVAIKGADYALKVLALELLECSVCTIGAHAGAVIQSDAIGNGDPKRFDAPEDIKWNTQTFADVKQGGTKEMVYSLDGIALDPETPATVAKSATVQVDTPEEPAPDTQAAAIDSLKDSISALTDTVKALSDKIDAEPEPEAQAVIEPDGQTPDPEDTEPAKPDGELAAPPVVPTEAELKATAEKVYQDWAIQNPDRIAEFDALAKRLAQARVDSQIEANLRRRKSR